MRDLDFVKLTRHNDGIVQRVLWLLEHNAPMSSLGFEIKDRTAQKIRALRGELHKGTDYKRNSALDPCSCARCSAIREDENVVP